MEGGSEIAFTILVHDPLARSRSSFRVLLMGGVVGRLFLEFAVTVVVTSILVSAVVSLTLTPMLCAKLLPAAVRGNMLIARARSVLHLAVYL